MAAPGGNDALTPTQTCEALGVSLKTFRNLLKEYPELLELMGFSRAEASKGNKGRAVCPPFVPKHSIRTLKKVILWRADGVKKEEIRKRIVCASMGSRPQKAARVEGRERPEPVPAEPPPAADEPKDLPKAASSAPPETSQSSAELPDDPPEAAKGEDALAQVAAAVEEAPLEEARRDEPEPDSAPQSRSDFLLAEYGRLVEELESLGKELRRSEERRAEDRDKLLTALMRTHQEIQHLKYEISQGRSRRDRKPRGFLRWLIGA